MIGYFRNRRSTLLPDNRLTRYLLYAAGEILLVVIGILIAMQVNNWNETRKAHAFEVVILQEIRENVRVNLERFRGLERRLQTSDAGIHLLLVELKKPVPDRERLAHYFTVLNNGIVFTYNRGAYDSVKAAGLDRLSNRSLRTVLIDYFDSFLPRHDRFIQYQYDGLLSNREALVVGLSEPFITRDSNDLKRVEMKFPADFDWAGRKFLSIIAAYSEANAGAHFRLQRVIAETESLLIALDAEIDGAPLATGASPSAVKHSAKQQAR